MADRWDRLMVKYDNM